MTLILSLFFIFSAHGQRIHFENGHSYPAAVGLTASEKWGNGQQTYGECHVQAAVSAAKAACYRRTGRVFDISTGYLFYRHIRTELANWNNEYFLSTLYPELFSQNDAGIFEITLSRIKNGSVMLNSEYSMRDFTKAVASPLKVRSQFWHLKETGRNPNTKEFERQLRSELTTALDQSLIQKNPKLMIQAEHGFNHIIFNQPSHPLNACGFSDLQMTEFALTPERAVALINNAIPFICQTSISGSGGQHVVLFAGYRYSKGYAENLSFTVIDSRLTRLDTGWAPYCHRAVVLYYPSEATIVQQSINQ